MSQEVRRAMRLEAVLEALGVSRSTFYEGVGKGIYPAPCKPDEDGRAAIWWDTEISAVQERAIERRDAKAPPQTPSMTPRARPNAKAPTAPSPGLAPTNSMKADRACRRAP
jgi:predicted DNA-binding transcriptional regulator AlpA